jgi:hypothetical protein
MLRRTWVAPAGLIVGGLLLALGSLFTFATASAGELRFDVQGLDTDDGKIFLGVGLFLVILGFVIGAVRSRGGRRVLGVLAFLGAGFMLYAAIVDVIDASEDLPLEGISQSPGIGLFMSGIGALLATVGALAAIFGRTEVETAAPPLPPPAPPPPAPPVSAP